MCSRVADFLIIDSSTSDCGGLSPPPSPHPADNNMEMKKSSRRTKPCRRNVHFKECHTEISIESLACLADTEKDKLWFTDGEIESFKARARATCEDIKLGITDQATAAGVEEDIRGLELRLCHDRQRRKYMILQAIIRAQKRFTDPKQLSNIARKCTVWSKAVAAIVAQRDYYNLYDPSRIGSVAAIPPLANYPLPFKAKEPCKIPTKRPTSPVPHGRCVRPRVAAPVAGPVATLVATPAPYTAAPFAAPC